MKFWDMSKDEREQWRKSDVTRAYLAEIEAQAAEVAEVALGAVRIGNHNDASWRLGSSDGLRKAYDVGARE